MCCELPGESGELEKHLDIYMGLADYSMTQGESCTVYVLLYLHSRK